MAHLTCIFKLFDRNLRLWLRIQIESISQALLLFFNLNSSNFSSSTYLLLFCLLLFLFFNNNHLYIAYLLFFQFFLLSISLIKMAQVNPTAIKDISKVSVNYLIILFGKLYNIFFATFNHNYLLLFTSLLLLVF